MDSYADIKKRVYIFSGSCIIGSVRTNKVLSVQDAMRAIGFDISRQADLKRGYELRIPGFRRNEITGAYSFDTDIVSLSD